MTRTCAMRHAMHADLAWAISDSGLLTTKTTTYVRYFFCLRTFQKGRNRSQSQHLNGFKNIPTSRCIYFPLHLFLSSLSFSLHVSLSFSLSLSLSLRISLFLSVSCSFRALKQPSGFSMHWQATFLFNRPLKID
jgi:hypothetical protein